MKKFWGRGFAKMLWPLSIKNLAFPMNRRCRGYWGKIFQQGARFPLEFPFLRKFM
jgi:hypothetical protein